MNSKARHGFTLLEIVVAVIVLMVLIRFAMPTYRVAVEQNRVDLAASRLLMIYTAQKMYFVDKAEYASDIYKLTNAKLLDKALEPGGGGDARYFYATTADNTANPKQFTATATRTTTPEPQYWEGTITINTSATIAGSIVSADASVTLTTSKYALGL